MSTKIQLPSIPKDEYYEDFVAAMLCVGGYFLERRIDLREPTNVLELDVVSFKYYSDHVDKCLSEIKSAGWNFTDVFKVRGWMDYLKLPDATFICLNTQKKDFSQMQDVANELSIKLLNISIDEKNIDEQALLDAYQIKKVDDNLWNCAVFSLRFSFCLERMMVDKYLSPMKKDPTCMKSVKSCCGYIYHVCEHSFFQNNPYKRIQEVFSVYQANKNITARMDYEKLHGIFEEADKASLSESSFRRLFYETPANKEILHVGLYAEMICRLTILQLCVEEIYRDKTLNELAKTLEHYGLPSNILHAIHELQDKHPYYYLYPHLWQLFIFLYGGFILLDKEQKEYHMLSELTGIPEAEIPNALTAFDILFPLHGGKWLIDKPYTKIRILQFMPLPFSGVGANFRRIIYRADDKNATYDNLKSVLTGNHTVDDLVKYNNLFVEYLSMDKKIVVESEK